MNAIATATVADPSTAMLANVIEEAKSKGDLVPAEVAAHQGDDKLVPVRPKWMTDKDEAEARQMADSLIAELKAAPGDLRLVTRAQSLGEDSKRKMTQPIALYKKKVVVVLEQNQKGNKTSMTLVDLKRQMDLVNPAVLRSKPLAVRWTLGLVKHLPNSDEVLKMIYDAKETVESTVDGLVENLRIDAENLEANLEEVALIYDNLFEGHRLLERDVYVGQLTLVGGRAYLDSMEAGPVRDNVEQFLADFTAQVVFLQQKRVANLMFFSGSQLFAKLTRAQLHNLRNLGPLLQDSVLANLGLNVATKELHRSMQDSKDLAQAIGNTIRDTGQQLDQMSGDMARIRAEGGINLEALEEGVAHIESAFLKQAEANQLIIDLGGKSLRRLDTMAQRLDQRVDSGHESMRSNTTTSAA